MPSNDALTEVAALQARLEASERLNAELVTALKQADAIADAAGDWETDDPRAGWRALIARVEAESSKDEAVQG